MAMFRRLHRMFDSGLSYGLGSKVYDLPDGSQRVHWIGHSGGGPGIKVVVAYEPRRKAFVAVVTNGDGDADAVAKLLLRWLDPGA